MGALGNGRFFCIGFGWRERCLVWLRIGTGDGSAVLPFSAPAVVPFSADPGPNEISGLDTAIRGTCRERLQAMSAVRQPGITAPAVLGGLFFPAPLVSSVGP